MTETKVSGKKTSHWLTFLSLSFLAIAGIFLIMIWSGLPPQLPWLYSQPWGETQLIPKLWFGLGLVVCGAINFINLAFSQKLYKNDAVTAMVVESASLLLTVMYLAAFFRVISIIM